MLGSKKYEDDMEDEDKKPEMKKEKQECCVCINVFTRCDKNHPWKKDEKFCDDDSEEKDKKEKKEEKQRCCVCINIFAECEKKEHKEHKDYID